MPRTLAQNAQYINETIKPAIKSAIEAQGVTVPSTDSFLDYADRIGEIEGGGSGYQLKDLPTGSISTVNDAAPLPLSALKVSVEAWQEGSGTPSPSNIRPIHGWTGAKITATDGTIWNEQTEQGSINNNTGQDEPSTIQLRSVDYTPVLANTEYCLVRPQNTAVRLFYYNNEKTFISNELKSGDANPYTTFTTPSSCGFIRFIIARQYGTTYNNDISINYPATDTSYHAYNGKQYTQQFPTTIYGAEWDVMNGEMKVTDGYIASYNGESLPSTWISDRDEYASGTTPTIGAEVVYKLATPTTIDLSPLSIRMLQGTNNLYADCGDVIEGEYFIGSSGAYDLYDYIQTDGTQLIDTGRAITAGDEVKTIFTAISGGSNGAYVWGKYADPYFTALIIYPNNSFYRHYDHATVNDNPVDQTNFTVGKITEDSYTVATTLGGNYTLFDTASVKLYAFSINGDDYLPCKRRSDGKFGLYDVKNSTFLTDSASGNAFVGGNNLGVRIG